MSFSFDQPLRRRVSRRQVISAGAVAVGAAGLGFLACNEDGGGGPTVTPEQIPISATPVAGGAPNPTPAPNLGMVISLGGDPSGIVEIAPGTIFFPFFGTVITFETEEGLVVVDTSLSSNGAQIVEELRNRTDAPVHTIVYTHGHVDHVGGADAFLKDAEERGDKRPRIIGHSRVVDRFRRYERMANHTRFINSIQFNVAFDPNNPAPTPVFAYPDETYEDRMELEVGGERFELVHGMGETDDHTWVWAPERNLVCAGDFFVHACPNVGNPWKVQRYAEGWAEGLEAIVAKNPALLLPGHGPPIEGESEVEEACLDTARYLRSIHDQVTERMNKGQWLEQILREVEPPADLAAKPYLQPIYGHPKFIVHGIWRQYGGWYGGDPADFFAAPTTAQGREMVALAGAAALVTRARELAAVGDVPLACHLVDAVLKAESENRDAWSLWKELFEARAATEVNMMARNVFKGAVTEAERHLA